MRSPIPQNLTDDQKRKLEPSWSPITRLTLRALDGDPEPLRDYFLRGPRQLDASDCYNLAWLIDHLPRRHRRGRRKGSGSVRTAALRTIIYLVRIGTKAWCAKADRKRISKNTPVDPLIARAIALAGQEGKISIEYVRKYILDDGGGVLKLKPKPTRMEAAEYFGDEGFCLVLEGACMKMEETALK